MKTKATNTAEICHQHSSAAFAGFDGYAIRREWDNKKEEWRFSTVDIVACLVETSDPNRYWSDLKRRLLKEGYQGYENIVRLNLVAPDGRKRQTDTINTEGVFRVLQSIPTPKAEPFKQWFANLGKERLEEIANPDKAVERGRKYFLNQGHSEEWVDKRLNSIATRKGLTDYWQNTGISEGWEFGSLTNVLSETTFGITPAQHKELKGLAKKDSLRNNMTDLELAINMVAETAVKEISTSMQANGYKQHKQAAKIGGGIANNTLQQIEAQIGRPIVSAATSRSLAKGSK